MEDMEKQDILEELSKINTVDPRQIVAYDKYKNQLFILNNGDHDKYREYAKSNLICPFPGCSSKVSTRGGKNVRSHFFHLSDYKGEHNPETLEHILAKHLIKEWGQSLNLIGVNVELEKRVAGKIPDVIIYRGVLPPKNYDENYINDTNESIVNIEIEYKYARGQERIKRNEILEQYGINTQWLFGFSKIEKYIVFNYPAPKYYILKKIPQHIMDTIDFSDSNNFIIFVDPLKGRVGTLINQKMDKIELRFHNSLKSNSVDINNLVELYGIGSVDLNTITNDKYHGRYLYMDKIEDCVLSKRGIITPTIRKIMTIKRKALYEHDLRKELLLEIVHGKED